MVGAWRSVRGREVLGESKEADRPSRWTWPTRMRKGIGCSCGLHVGSNMIFFFLLLCGECTIEVQEWKSGASYNRRLFTQAGMMVAWTVLI